jgi:replication factor A1
MSDVRKHAEDIYEQFSEHLDVTVADVEERLDNLVNEYRVPAEEARRSVMNHYLDEAGMERESLSSNAEVELADINREEEWVDVTAKVVELWEPRSDSIAQVGLLGDPSGTIKFTKWAKSDLPALEEGQVYRLTNVVTDEYQGRYSVKLNSTTGIEELEGDLEIGDNVTEVEGALVDIQNGSGLIKRRVDDGRVVQNEAGDVETEFDLRIKAVLDDGLAVQEVIFDAEATEDVTGISLDEAKEMAMDALDTSIVADEIRGDVIGTYYRVSGPQMGRYVLADEVEELAGPTDAEEVLIKARSM